MIKEDKNVDLITSGRKPSEEDFARISDWIKRDKQKQTISKEEKKLARKKSGKLSRVTRNTKMEEK